MLSLLCWGLALWGLMALVWVVGQQTMKWWQVWRSRSLIRRRLGLLTSEPPQVDRPGARWDRRHSDDPAA